MANISGAVVFKEGVMKQLAPDGEWSWGTGQPKNEGPLAVYIYASPSGPPADVAALIAGGDRYDPGDKLPFGDATEGLNLANYWGVAVPESAPAPTTVVATQQIICDTGGDSGFPSVATFTSGGGFTQPAVSSDVEVTVVDGTVFEGTSAGAELYCAGCLYAFVSVTGTVDATLTMTNMGIGASRVALSA